MAGAVQCPVSSRYIPCSRDILPPSYTYCCSVFHQRRYADYTFEIYTTGYTFNSLYCVKCYDNITALLIRDLFFDDLDWFGPPIVGVILEQLDKCYE